ncbi:hypothetical protein [Plantactinospora mayteni]|uniref:hypothetical protein n=1 Tax=Plantactinospora mayteni TaxID=566021 RepID=UPI00194213B5|nr:hypothetical protein [Plantactinospora mayteni]
MVATTTLAGYGYRASAMICSVARLQLNVALAALRSAYEEWQVDQPFDRFLATARAYLQQLADGVHPGHR